MEAKGAVNQYMPYVRPARFPDPPAPGQLRDPAGTPVFTVNFAAGVTPFIKHFDGREYASQCYRLTKVPVTITHAWYRPSLERFKTLDEHSKDHVLNGGLLCNPLAVAMADQLPDDPVEHTWEYERFQEFCLKTYGRRRPPMEVPPR